MSGEVCGVDNFAITLERLLGSVAKATSEKTSEAVERATKKGVSTVRKKAKATGKHPWSNRYVNGFTSNVERGVRASGEIGNKNEPGLVHLLEKGHATLTGRRTNAYPHMAPAFEEIQQDFIKMVGDAVQDALEG